MTDRTTDRPSEIVKELEKLAVRVAEVAEAAKLNPISRDIYFLEVCLAKKWNSLCAELSAAGISHDYKPKTISEDKPQPLNGFQEMFIREGIDVRDILREPDQPKKKRSTIGDGLDAWVS